MGHSTKAHPKALKAVALALFTAGKSSTQVAETTGLKPGCIKSWIKRESWTAARSQARELTVEATRRVIADELAKLGPQTRQTLAQGVHKLAEVVTDDHATPSKLATAQQKARIADTLTRSAKTLHGWADGAEQTPLVRYEVIEGCLAELEREAESQGQVVDLGEQGGQGDGGLVVTDSPPVAVAGRVLSVASRFDRQNLQGDECPQPCGCGCV